MVTSTARLICLAILYLMVAGCALPDPPYRTTRMESDICSNFHDLTGRNQEMLSPALARSFTPAEVEALHRCPLQQHLLPGAAEARKASVGESEETTPDSSESVITSFGDAPRNDWTTRAEKASRNLKHSDSYHLAFVELEEVEEELLQRQQKALLNHLVLRDRAGAQNVVVVYVHGWRHDAALRDGDIRKFRRLLGYSRAALNTRCIEKGHYCNADVTGVFVGWRGRLFDEGATDTGNGGVETGIGAVGPVLTFWNRFDQSNCLGRGGAKCAARLSGRDTSPLRDLLREVQAGLKIRPGDPRADKLLIVGHSMGGNMLATMLSFDAVKKVKQHKSGREMSPLLGDLIVLLNPASRAENWARIQLEERRKAGFDDDDATLTCFGGDNQPDPDCQATRGRKLADWHGIYPVSQRPIYISLTSSNDWGGLRTPGRDIDHDRATGAIFPLSQSVAGEDERARIVALGHALPRYSDRRTVAGQAVGTSHEMAVLEGAQTDQGARYASSYDSSVKLEAAWCAPADGWLLRSRAPEGRLIKNWDYGYVPTTDGTVVSSRNVGGPQNKASVQWRQGIYTTEYRNALSVSPSTSPFWNARALDSAIRGHAGWANYATWCAINQLVLDDVTVPIAPPDVEEALKMGMPVEALKEETLTE